MNTGLWKMDSGLAAARRPGMTPEMRSLSKPHAAQAGGDFAAGWLFGL
jgi:hypothetical protein